MKRTPTSPLQHHAKKPKVSSSPPKNPFTPGPAKPLENLAMLDNDPEGTWTKVEKRKAKKAVKKAEARLDVSMLLIFLFQLNFLQVYSSKVHVLQF